MLLDTARKILMNSGLDPGQKIVIITDNRELEIGKAFFKASFELVIQKKLGSYIFFNLDDLGKRPLKEVPAKIRESVLEADLLIQVISKAGSEDAIEYIYYRKPLIDLKYENRKLRIGQILDISDNDFSEIFSFEPESVRALNQRIITLLTEKEKNTVRITTPKGTDLTLTISNKYRWINQDADLTRPSHQHSLLAGEVYGCPISADGIIVADGVIGGPFSGYGELSKTPLIIQIRDSRIASVSSVSEELEKDFVDHISRYENAERIGEIGFGTNLSLKRFYGIIGIDEKYPGCHIAFGHPYSEKTGAEWACAIHIDAVLKETSCWIGEKRILEDGRYII